MATHFCFNCPGCRAGCPLCGRCRCKIENWNPVKMCRCGNGLVGMNHACKPVDSVRQYRFMPEVLFDGFVEGDLSD